MVNIMFGLEIVVLRYKEYIFDAKIRNQKESHIQQLTCLVQL